MNSLGCPSGIVAGDNQMGASLMKEAEVVRDCCGSMISVTKGLNVDISVKCRIGIDKDDSYEFLSNFISKVAESGVNSFQVHARKALLGFTTTANRVDVPLNYDYVYRLASDFPEISFEINGGIQSIEEIKEHMKVSNVKGGMVGRACVNHPYLWTRVDSHLNGKQNNIMSRGEILKNYIQYCKKIENELYGELLVSGSSSGTRRRVLSHEHVGSLVSPIYNLFVGEECNDKFQRFLKRCTNKGKMKSSSLIISEAVKIIPDCILTSTDVKPISELSSPHPKDKNLRGIMKKIIV